MVKTFITIERKLVKIGDSAGVILNKKLLKKYGFEIGDKVDVKIIALKYRFQDELEEFCNKKTIIDIITIHKEILTGEVIELTSVEKRPSVVLINKEKDEKYVIQLPFIKEIREAKQDG